MSKFEDYIKEVVDKLPTSEPIFEADLDKTCIVFELKERIYPDVSNVTDPVEKIIVEQAHEQMRRICDDWSDTHFIRRAEPNYVFSRMQEVVQAVYEKNCGLKNPRQTKMYKWLESMYGKYNHESYEGFVELYRYIAKHADLSGAHGTYRGRLDQVHANNVIYVLEKMRQKYEN